MDNDYAIILENVSKKYRLYSSKKDRMKEALDPLKRKFHKDFYAVKDLNLKVKKGEILGIVGRNGAGKSTLLKLIAGVIQPTTGKIWTKGNIVPLLELGSGFNPEYTGLENIYFYSSLIGFSRKETEKKIQEIIDFAEIGEFIHQPIKTYSSGMKARLAFAVSVNVDPDILILDEVLAVGDELFRRKSFAKMEEFFNSKKTILFVSHSISSINELCTNAILVDKGKIILSGEPKKVTTFYQKLLFSVKDNQEKVLEEIKLLNENKKTQDCPGYSQNDFDAENFSNSKEIDTESYFLPELKPKSTIEYANYDVKFSEIYVETTDGRKVNVLKPGNNYIYVYTVKFNIEAINIFFGMQIKTEKGQVLCASNYPDISYGESYIDKIEKGKSVTVKWRFSCNFLKGNYYLNCGISSFKNDTQYFLNRIIDSAVFKVMPLDKNFMWGIVYIDHIPTMEYH